MFPDSLKSTDYIIPTPRVTMEVDNFFDIYREWRRDRELVDGNRQQPRGGVAAAVLDADDEIKDAADRGNAADDAVGQHVGHGHGDRTGQAVALPGLAVALGGTAAAVTGIQTQVTPAQRVIGGQAAAEQRGQADAGIAVLADRRIRAGFAAAHCQAVSTG